jgi:CelD/BcsL family acetyltransferase involved in cellulose biosynthesis
MPKIEPRLHVRQLGLPELAPSDLEAWSALEARAAEPNAFLSPHFILPAVRHLDPASSPMVLVVERDGGARGARKELLALGVFSAVAASRIFPLPHLVGYCSRHSYLGGLLVDRDHVRDAVSALYMHARKPLFGWQAIVFPKLQTDGPVASMLEERARAAGLAVQRAGAKSRAILLPSAAGPEALKKALGKRLNEIERCKRRLTESGEVSWHCLRQSVEAATVENFLRLEHQGWKAEAKTSLRADPADEAFFKDVVVRFDGDSRALFTELRVGGRAIASTSNFVSGGVGFAFKVGWDAELRKVGPGLINEAEFVRAAPKVCADLAWFDSGAQPDSFIDRLWPERRELGTLVVPLTRTGSASLRVLSGLRRVARRLRSLRPTRGEREEREAPEASRASS